MLMESTVLGLIQKIIGMMLHAKVNLSESVRLEAVGPEFNSYSVNFNLLKNIFKDINR